MNYLQGLLGAVVCAACLVASCSASATEVSDIGAVVAKWVRDFNTGNVKSLEDACMPRMAIVDDFPPYAWRTCADWMTGYALNNKAIQLSVTAVLRPPWSRSSGRPKAEVRRGGSWGGPERCG
jgi:hypothetical protein